MSKRLESSSVDLRRDMGIEKMVNLMGHVSLTSMLHIVKKLRRCVTCSSWRSSKVICHNKLHVKFLVSCDKDVGSGKSSKIILISL